MGEELTGRLTRYLQGATLVHAVHGRHAAHERSRTATRRASETDEVLEARFFISGVCMNEVVGTKAQRRNAPRGTSGRRRDARIFVSLEPSLLTRLKGLAQFRGWSVSRIGASLIEAGLQNDQTGEAK